MLQFYFCLSFELRNNHNILYLQPYKQKPSFKTSPYSNLETGLKLVLLLLQICGAKNLRLNLSLVEYVLVHLTEKFIEQIMTLIGVGFIICCVNFLWHLLKVGKLDPLLDQHNYIYFLAKAKAALQK